MQYRLVIHRAGSEPVHVFLADGPAGNPPGQLVRLHEIRPPVGRRVLGRSVLTPTCYREFRSGVELLTAGYEPAGPYRVCDSWDDFLNPWGAPAPADPTKRMEE